MKRFNVLGLSALATALISASMITSPASAWEFTASKAGAKLAHSVVSEHMFEITGSTVKCSSISFSGSTPGTAYTTQTVTPSYSSCTAFGFAGATVDTSGCSYTLWDWKELDITGCTKGGITISVSVPFIAKCMVEIPNQIGLPGISYSNGFNDINVSFFITDLYTEVKESTGACPLSVGNHYHSGYTGQSTLQAEGATLSWDF